jgi:hypothetical protein
MTPANDTRQPAEAPARLSNLDGRHRKASNETLPLSPPSTPDVSPELPNVWLGTPSAPVPPTRPDLRAVASSQRRPQMQACRPRTRAEPTRIKRPQHHNRYIPARAAAFRHRAAPWTLTAPRQGFSNWQAIGGQLGDEAADGRAWAHYRKQGGLQDAASDSCLHRLLTCRMPRSGFPVS